MRRRWWWCRFLDLLLLAVVLVRSIPGSLGQSSKLGDERGSNDLNIALQHVISEMVKADFFLEQWSYFPFKTGLGVPVPILDTCFDGAIVDPATADASLRRVLETRQLRIGVSTILAGRPLLYSTTPGADETNLTAGNLDGYEIACAREATRRLGQVYDRTIEPVFVPIDGDDFFDSLRDAQWAEETDLIWSGVTVRENRQAQVDFVCTTFQTDTVIGAAPGAELADFPVDGPPVNVTCIAVYCSIDVPPPFQKVVFDGDVKDALVLLAEPDNGYDYHLRTIEQLATFFAQSCSNCSYAQVPPVTTNYWAPFTAYTYKTMDGAAGHGTKVSRDSSTAAASWKGKAVSSSFASLPLLLFVMLSL